MAQYSAYHETIEAYVIGSASPPDWFNDAVANKTVILKQKAVGDGMTFEKAQVADKYGGYHDAVTGDAVIQLTDGSFSVMYSDTFEDLYLLDAAELITVCEVADTALTGGDGLTEAGAIVFGVDVANTVATLGLADLAVSKDATAYLYSDAFTTPVTGMSTITLTAGAKTTAYVKIVSAHGTLTRYYKVEVTRADA
jgi:hypothetical protein